MEALHAEGRLELARLNSGEVFYMEAARSKALSQD